MTQDPLQPVGWRRLAGRSAAMIIAAVLVLMVQGSQSVHVYDGVMYYGRGWPAVSYSERNVWAPTNAPVGVKANRRLEFDRSPLGYAINGLTLAAIMVLASMLDRLGQPEQFGMWRLFVIMVACSVILACVKAADAHNAQFLTGVPTASAPAP
jgi:hypothetical protein